MINTKIDTIFIIFNLKNILVTTSIMENNEIDCFNKPNSNRSSSLSKSNNEWSGYYNVINLIGLSFYQGLIEFER